jgi:PBSX family phage terminase large subunit
MDITSLWHKLTDSEKDEITRLLNSPVVPNVLNDAFPLQRQFIEDKNKLKALFCTRRSAKSYTAGLYLIKTALERPNTSSVYIGLTRESTKRIIWDDIFKAILKKFNIPAKFNETELSISFDNNSRIFCASVDDGEAEQDKLLGKKYALCVIDEAASYTIDLKNLIYKILLPACSDLGGSIILVGTPDNRKVGIFYDITCDTPVHPPSRKSIAGWSLWTWSTYDNPHMAVQWQETIDELKKNDPNIEEQPFYQQHYLGKWVIEDSNKIYRYSASRNAWDGILKDYGWKTWQYVLGVDLGFSDATALSLLAYHEHDSHVHIVRAEKRRGITISETADWIRQWMGEYPINYFVVDGANKQAVEEMVKHHNIPLIAAEKTDKVSFIRIMNSDFISGKIKVYEPACKQLTEEYDKLIWNKRALERGIYKEDTSYHGDLCDASLYAYRYTYAYAHTAADPSLFYKSDIEKEMLAMNERFNREKAEKDMLYEGSEYLF